MIAVLRFHRIADLSGLHRERRLVELRHHAAALEEVEIAAVLRAAFVFGILPRQLGEVGAAARLLQQLLDFGLDRRFVLAFGLQQDVARTHLLGGGVLLDVVVVGAFDIAGRHVHPGAHRLDVDEQITDLALLGHLEVVLVRLEVRCHVRIGRRDVLAERVGGEADHRQLDLVVPAPVFLFEVLLADRQPVGDRGAQLFDRDGAADGVFELGGGQRRALQAQQLLIALLADEIAVFLKRRHGEDALPHFLVARLDAEPLGLGQRRALVHQRLQDLLIDAQLLEQLFAHVSAIRGTIGLQLRLVRPPEFAGGDLMARHVGDGFPRRGVRPRAPHELGDVENHERQHDEAETPFEPAAVLAHAIEHCHKSTS